MGVGFSRPYSLFPYFVFFIFKKEGKSNTDCKARGGHEITGVPLFLVKFSLSLGFIATPLCMISQSLAENSRLGLKAEQESGNNIKQPLSCKKKAFCSQLGCDHVGLLARVELFPLIANASWDACRGSGIWVTSSKLCVHFFFLSENKFHHTSSLFHRPTVELLVVLFWVVLWIACLWYPHAVQRIQGQFRPLWGSQPNNKNQMFMRYFCLWQDSIWTCPSDQLISYSSCGIHWGQNKHRLCWKLCPHCRTSVKHCTRDNLNIPLSWQITASKLLCKALKCSKVFFEVLNILPEK